MKFIYDEKAKAAYIYYPDKARAVSYSKEGLLPVVIDYDENGEMIGLEILNFYNVRQK